MVAKEAMELHSVYGVHPDILRLRMHKDFSVQQNVEYYIIITALVSKIKCSSLFQSGMKDDKEMCEYIELCGVQAGDFIIKLFKLNISSKDVIAPMYNYSGAYRTDESYLVHLERYIEALTTCIIDVTVDNLSFLNAKAYDDIFKAICSGVKLDLERVQTGDAKYLIDVVKLHNGSQSAKQLYA